MAGSFAMRFPTSWKHPLLMGRLGSSWEVLLGSCWGFLVDFGVSRGSWEAHLTDVIFAASRKYHLLVEFWGLLGVLRS